MGKHLNHKIKYNYVMRYQKNEKLINLALEMREKGYSQAKPKSLSVLILQWNQKYLQQGINGLKIKTGKRRKPGQGRPRKKQKIDYEKLPKDELVKIIKIQEDIIEIFKDELEKHTRPRFRYKIVKYISDNYGLAIKKACNLVYISKSGYYKWLKNPKSTDNYNQEILEIISSEFKNFKEIYGAYRLWLNLTSNNVLSISLKTFKRYYRFLGLKAKIRVPKKPREYKNTVLKKNFVRKSFNGTLSRKTIFTDVTQFRVKQKWVYISATIDSSNNELLDIRWSNFNNLDLVYKNVEASIKKVGSKMFLHSDNAMSYQSLKFYEMVIKYKAIQSFSKPGNSLENRPVEYFFSILKQEYLNQNPGIKLENLTNILENIKYHYNFIRKQGCLRWKSPARCRA